MDKKSVLAIIARLRSQIEARGIRVSLLILFGSFAKGNFTESSDIDIVVVSDDFAGKGYWERIDILSDAIYFFAILSLPLCPGPTKSAIEIIPHC